MREASPHRLRAVAQLCCLLVMGLALPSLALRSSKLASWLKGEPEKRKKVKGIFRASAGVHDAQDGREVLQKKRPAWVLLGNSQLNSRIEHDFLSELTGVKTHKLSIAATKSVMWYLMFKQMILQSGTAPKCVTIFFWERDLTRPYDRFLYNEAMVNHLHGREEPEWPIVMGRMDAALLGSRQQLMSQVETPLAQLYPRERLNEWARGKVQKLGFQLTGRGLNVTERKAELNGRVSYEHQRDRKAQASVEDPAQLARRAEAQKLENFMPIAFDAGPSQSFLPHLVKLAKEAGITLHFHSIKGNPEVPLPDTEAVHRLPEYFADLKVYLASEGCLFTEEKDWANITADMYADHLHLKTEPAVQQAYMRHFWKEVGPVVAPVLRGAQP
jgi:hypothetical protein